MTRDKFSEARVKKFVESFRQSTGQLPTLKDLEKEGFEKAAVEALVKNRVLSQWYITLTNGTLVKGYKVSD